MDKKFSEGFMHDIADLLEICSGGNTDTIELSFDVNGKKTECRNDIFSRK